MAVLIDELLKAANAASTRDDRADADNAGKPRGPEGVRRMLHSLNRLREAWLRRIPPAARS